MAHKRRRQAGKKLKFTKLSSETFTQARDLGIAKRGGVSPNKIVAGEGPELDQGNPAVASEWAHNGGTVNVRAKLTEYQRRHLRIARIIVSD